MSRRLVISPLAERDLRAIWVWTSESFGETQADRYLDELESAMDACAAAPERGKDRSAIRRGYRSVLVRSHVLFYTWDEATVQIQRVLHGNMEFEAHLPKDP